MSGETMQSFVSALTTGDNALTNTNKVKINGTR